MTSRRLPHGAHAPVVAEALPPSEVAVGQWYWVKETEGQEQADGTFVDVEVEHFRCVTHIGSNFTELTGVEAPRGSLRVHHDEFWTRCRYEASPDQVIAENLGAKRAELDKLLGDVQQIVSQLALTPEGYLSAGGETAALARRTGPERDMEAYGQALVKAKNESLPRIFGAIEACNRSMSQWLKAQTIPLMAEADGHRRIIGRIEDRIFSVELYAGLVEEVVEVRGGAPAPLAEPIHLLQRRAYMDEECLARYETGGMTFEGIEDFDRWIARPEHFARILPFPRAAIAFRVRRHELEREAHDLADFIRIQHELQADRATFLYLRNGEQLYRMRTEIEFGETLFPDRMAGPLGKTGKRWARMFAGRVQALLSDADYQERLATYRRELPVWEEAYRRYEADRAEDLTGDEPKKHVAPWPGTEPTNPEDEYEPVDKSNVHYDDILAYIEAQNRAQNRIALVLQGLLDRSPVFHPHPPWQVWTEEGFQAAFVLVADEARALTPGAAPDFEAYRARLNASIQPGSVTVGQEIAWEKAEAEKESQRRDADWRERSRWRPTRWRPQGNPGPGTLAEVLEVAPWRKRKGDEDEDDDDHENKLRCTFAWLRKTRDGKPQRQTFSCSSSVLLHASAYQAGDFRQFFDDPRTRAEYMRWAPLLLVAEEYRNGLRARQAAVRRPPPREPSSKEGQRRYQRKRRLALLRKGAVRLRYEVTTRGGTVHDKGSLWRIDFAESTGLALQGLQADGTDDDRVLRGVSLDDVEAAPEMTPKKREGGGPRR